MSEALLGFEAAFRRWMEERDMRWGDLSTHSLSGFRLAPSDHPRRAVLALHGAGNDALFGWVGLFKELLLSGAEIFSFDLPGHGRRTHGTFDPEGGVGAIRHAWEVMSREAVGLPLHVVGVSLGGSLLVAALPSLVPAPASATVVVAPLRIRLSTSTLLPEIGIGTLRLLWREREHYGWTGLIPSFGPFRRDIYPLRLGVKPPPGTFGYVHTLNAALAELDLEGTARRVGVPTLLACGTRDRIVPAEQAEALARAMPRSELMWIEGGTHLSTPLDRAFRRRVLTWMEEWE